MRRPHFFLQCVAALVSVSMLTGVAQAQQKTAKACEAEWRASKTAIQASGKKKKDFISECREGKVQTSAAAPATPPAAQAAAPSERAKAAPGAPASQPQAPAAAQENPAAPPSRTAAVRQRDNTALPSRRVTTSLAEGQYATEGEAKAHCPTDTVVWANTRSKVYHFPGSRTYGRTRSGAYMCEKDTGAAGIRSAKNEKRR